MANELNYTQYAGSQITFQSGVNSDKDPALIDNGAFAEGVNVIIDNEGMVMKIEGTSLYNATVTTASQPIKGTFSFIGEDGREYNIIAANSKLYFTNGNGTYTAIKYEAENVDLAIDTDNNFFRFIDFDRVISGVQKKIIYVYNGNYPVSKNTNGTANKYCTISRAIRLQISGSVIIVKNIYWDSDGSRTAGSDDIEVGRGAVASVDYLVGFPQSASYIVKIFDRLVASSYVDDSGNTIKNGWIASEAQDSEDWTNASVSSNTGGGKSPQAFTGSIIKDTSILTPSRYGWLRIDCVPGPITNWREYYLNTRLGAINNESIVLHKDNWIYYMSEEGICRTDGRICERVDLSIENNIKDLTQIKNNSRSISVSDTAEFNQGTPSNGDNLIDTTGGMLKQKNLSPGYTEIVNPSFENGFDNWTKNDGLWVIAIDTPYYGSKYANCPIKYTPGSVQAYILDSTNTVLKTYAPNNATSWTKYTIAQADLTSYIGTDIKISFGCGTSSLTSDAFTYKGECIYFYYKKTQTSGLGFSHSMAVDKIFVGFTSFSTVVDYGTTPSSFGNLTAHADFTNLAIGAVSQVGYSIRTSSDNITYGSTIAAFTLNKTTPSNTLSLATVTLARYVSIDATVTIASEETVNLTGLYIGAQWKSAILDFGSVPGALGVFSAGEVDNGQTVKFEIATATATASYANNTNNAFVEITNGIVPTGVTLARYPMFRVSLNTIDYLDVPTVQDLTQSFLIGTNGEMPAFGSFRDRLYFSIMENGQTTNNVTWVATTKPEPTLKYTPSGYTGVNYPLFTKCDFIGAKIFSTYLGKPIYGSATQSNIYNIAEGTTNNGTVFTSYFTTRAFSTIDVETIWRFLFLYSKSTNAYTIEYRTRKGDTDWSAWSTSKTITPSNLVSRKAKYTLPGINSSDYIQFKISTIYTDAVFAIGGISFYMSPKSLGRGN